MTDADVDGAHIRTFFDFFFRFMRPLLKQDMFILHSHHFIK